MKDRSIRTFTRVAALTAVSYTHLDVYKRQVLTVTKNTPLTLFEDSLYRHFVESGLEPYMEGTS